MNDPVNAAHAFWQMQDFGDAQDAGTQGGAHKENASAHSTFGLSSFDTDEQQAFGRNVRLAMAMMEGSCRHSIPPRNRTGKNPAQNKALPDDPDAIALRLKTLGKELAANMADQLELLVRFDEKEGWRKSGANHCVAWMNLELAISLQLGWEYLRVGRKLRGLPVIKALFRCGRLSWSIVRLLSRVANSDNEALLCHSALDASVSEVERLCSAYRWSSDSNEDDSNDGDGDGDQDNERARAMQQFNARSFTWRKVGNGNTEIRLSLPPDKAEAFLHSIEHSLSDIENQDDLMPQKRADAAVLMAEAALQTDGREMAAADRYQVIVNVDVDQLCKTSNAGSTSNAGKSGKGAPHQLPDFNRPTRRPVLQGNIVIARETARRHACDCSVSTIVHSAGEPIDIGRKSRLWPAGMTRAIKARDQHCQFPGCTATRHLQIHHMQHWADGGSTCVENGVCLCSKHHTFVHEGGYRIERVDRSRNKREKQYLRQAFTDKTALSIETGLRRSRESFERVRHHAPERFRFQIVDDNGVDVRDKF